MRPMLQTPSAILGLPRWAWLAVTAWGAVALVAQAVGYQNTYPDEVYYWTWSRRPLEWGYFSKPPLIAWFHAITTAAFGDTILGIRSWVVLMNAGTVVLGGMLVHDATRKAGAALLAMGLLQCMMNFVADTNKLQNFFWMLTLFAVVRAVQRDPRYWLVTGTALAFGILGKHTVAFLLPVLAVFVALRARNHIRRPSFWGV